MSSAATRLRLGTRGSPLARWQADWVNGRLTELGIQVELVLITTQGDVRSGPLGEIGGQGLFTKEIQRALLDDQIDLAVHSLKDLPTEPVDGLTLAAVPKRASAHDVLVTRLTTDWEQLPNGARVGTGSLRRRAQLMYRRPDLRLEDVRGNVETRLQKLDDGHYDALVLAEAGLTRLGLAARIAQIIPVESMLPAIGQGALGLETRADDQTTQRITAHLNDPATQAAVLAERTLLARLRAGCLAPVGALGEAIDGLVRIRAVVLSSDGQRRLLAEASGPQEQAAETGLRAAELLLEQGAEQLIASSKW